MTIETTLQKNLYFNPENNFAIFRSVDGYALKGYLLDEPESLMEVKISFEGEFGNSKYGREFTFSSYKILENELYFFLTKIAKGITKTAATQIVKKYGTIFDELIDKNPDELLTIKGVGKKKLQKLIQTWSESKDLKELAGRLTPFGVSANLIVRIYRYFGANSVKIVDTDPYRLFEIRGVGFKKADEIARKLGVLFDDPKRIKACFLYVLHEKMVGNGHTYIKEGQLRGYLIEESSINGEEISDFSYEMAKMELIQRGKIIFFDIDKISLKDIYDAEQIIVQKLEQASKMEAEELLEGGELETFIAHYEHKYSISLGQKQKEAIFLANKNKKVFALTGYAGTGKTSVSKAILKLFEQKYGYESIVCCALSGIAASRVKKQSGYQAFTIHSLLGYDPAKNGFSFDRDKKLEYAVVLLDESSMVDVDMFRSMLEAIDFERTTLIMLGDPAQLPPVGAGEVFSDLLRFGLIEYVTLDKIYRQSDDKVITLFAQEVRQGNVPQIVKKYEDFEFADFSIPNYWQLKKTLSPKELSSLVEENQLKICDFISKKGEEVLPFIKENYIKNVWDSLTYFQVITPMKEGLLGAKNLNILLQNVLNPQNQSQTVLELKSGRNFRKGDKVIHLQNKKMVYMDTQEYKQKIKDGVEPQTKERKVYNGQIGTLFAANQEEDEYFIFYPNEGYVALYCQSDFSSGVVDLAYALTIHKTQGSEFTNVVIPTVNSHWIMLNNKLLYTAMTRAKDKLTIIGEKYAFSAGCKKSDETARDTVTKAMQLR